MNPWCDLGRTVFSPVSGKILVSYQFSVGLRTGRRAYEQSDVLSSNERRVLLQLARRAIEARLADCALELPPATGGLSRRTGAFVTLKRDERLRGCIGSVEREEPLTEVVARCAGDAATRDPRFTPLTPAELSEVVLEISVIGPFDPVTDPARIVVGRHGLAVEQGRQHGLLLPQVATEHHWSSEAFLGQTCVKAGLPADAWRCGATVFSFEAVVFSESPIP